MRLFLISASTLVLAACTPAQTPAPAAETPAPVAETAAAAAPEVAYGRAGTYKLDPTHASITWKVDHFGLSKYTARFKKFDATLTFNPQDVSANAIEVTIDPLSVETDYPGDYTATHQGTPYASWNEDLGKDAKWLNGAAFPVITFKSTGAMQTSPTTGTVTGDLTFLGVTKPVTLDVTYNGVAQMPWAPDQDKIGFSARTVIKRSDFGNTTFAPNIGDEVEVIVEAEFSEVPATPL